MATHNAKKPIKEWQRMNNASKTLDIDETLARWDEIMTRTRAGEIVVISFAGQPKTKLVPIGPNSVSGVAHGR